MQPIDRDTADLREVPTWSEEHLVQLHHLYQGEWWTKRRSIEATRRVVHGSQICLGLETHAGELVGFARVLTDFTFKAFIFDVIVARAPERLNPSRRRASRRPCRHAP